MRQPPHQLPNPNNNLLWKEKSTFGHYSGTYPANNQYNNIMLYVHTIILGSLDGSIHVVYYTTLVTYNAAT